MLPFNYLFRGFRYLALHRAREETRKVDCYVAMSPPYGGCATWDSAPKETQVDCFKNQKNPWYSKKKDFHQLVLDLASRIAVVHVPSRDRSQKKPSFAKCHSYSILK